ncbi:hypothetical protein JXA32_12695 [Candidatus Sumerlaeota bacterium]|nr:hypothetical protein [Candidatus Sumerlaeota bacterium]
MKRLERLKTWEFWKAMFLRALELLILLAAMLVLNQLADDDFQTISRIEHIGFLPAGHFHIFELTPLMSVLIPIPLLLLLLARSRAIATGAAVTLILLALTHEAFEPFAKIAANPVMIVMIAVMLLLFYFFRQKPYIFISLSVIILLIAILSQLPKILYALSYIDGINPLGTMLTPSNGMILLLALISYCFKSRVRFVAFTVIFLLVVFIWAYMRWSYPVVHEIRSSYAKSPLLNPVDPGLMIPFHFIVYRALAIWVVIFISGLIACRRQFGWMRFIFACTVAAAILQPLVNGLDAWLVVRNIAAQTFLCVLILRLPLLRQSVEQMAGFPLQSMPDDAPPAWEPRRTTENLILLATALLLLGIIGLGAVSAYYERRTIRFISGYLPPRPMPSALHNAFDDLGARFVKRPNLIPGFVISIKYYQPLIRTPNDRPVKSEIKDLPVTIPAAFLFQGASNLSKEALDEALEYVDIPGTLEAISSAPLEPYVGAFIRASRADYCFFHTGEMYLIPNFIALREISWLIAMRANIYCHQGDSHAAEEDIEALYRMGWLLTDDAGTLVTYMIGVALKGISLSAAGSWYLHFKDDPAALDVMAQRLERLAPLARLPWDSAGRLKENETGIGPVVPFFELNAPSLVRAITTYYAKWVQFDFLQLAVALERYRLEHGTYPETLDPLAPNYIKRIPLDPFEGKWYIYSQDSDSFSLYCPALDNIEWMRDSSRWAPGSSDDDIREMIERAKNPKTKDESGPVMYLDRKGRR